jgi:hypothetical protein
MLVPCVAVLGLALPGPPAARLRPGLYAALGVLAGYTLHPQAPDTFSFLWLHAVRKVVNAGGEAVGAEWLPTDTVTWLMHTWPVLALLGWSAWREGARPPGADTRALGVLAVGWALASALAVKWLEYAVPFAVAALALRWRDRQLGPRVLWLGLPLALWNGAAVLEHVRGTVPAADRLRALAARLPTEDCRVFHADWTDFSELFFWAPQCSYTVGLDPHFLSAADPRRAGLVEAALAGRVTRLGDMAEEVFGAGWVVTTNPAMEARARQDPRLEAAYLEGGVGLWRVSAGP